MKKLIYLFLICISLHSFGQGTGVFPPVSTSGTDTYTAPAPAGCSPCTAYVTNGLYRVKFTNPNTTSSTINIASIGAKSIVRPDGSAVVGNDLTGFQLLLYDGTKFQMMGSGGVVTASNGLTKTANNIALGGSLTGNTTINLGSTNTITFDGVTTDPINQLVLDCNILIPGTDTHWQVMTGNDLNIESPDQTAGLNISGFHIIGVSPAESFTQTVGNLAYSQITFDSTAGYDIRLGRTGNVFTVSAANSSGVQISGFKGIQYGHDYSGSYTARSLIDKGYLDSRMLTGSATLDFPSTASTAVANLTITVTGATVGKPCSVGALNASVTTTASFYCWVSSANTVTVRFSPKATEDPASGVFSVVVFN